MGRWILVWKGEINLFLSEVLNLIKLSTIVNYECAITTARGGRKPENDKKALSKNAGRTGDTSNTGVLLSQKTDGRVPRGESQHEKVEEKRREIAGSHQEEQRRERGGKELGEGVIAEGLTVFEDCEGDQIRKRAQT